MRFHLPALRLSRAVAPPILLAAGQGPASLRTACGTATNLDYRRQHSEILAEHRLGHEVPGMRGLYAHVSAPMRAGLTAALQTRWEDSLKARAALHPYSPVPLLNELPAPFRAGPETRISLKVPRKAPADADRPEKMISQIPPKSAPQLAEQGVAKLTKEHLTWANTSPSLVSAAATRQTLRSPAFPPTGTDWPSCSQCTARPPS